MNSALAAAKRPGFKSFSLNVRGDVKMDVSYNIQKTRNVGGIIRGSGREGEAVVFCAHWDHLGIGKPDEHGDTIYNGAADNASGMAGALLVAKKFKDMAQPRRDLVFLFPSSEESGLFGSAYYCDHPVVPMEKTVACLNFESIGPAGLTRDVVILGGGESDLDHYYVAAAAAQGRYVYFDDDNSDGWFFRSDHYNFVKKGVPCGQKSSKSQQIRQIGFHNGTSPTCRPIGGPLSHSAAHSSAVDGTMCFARQQVS